MNFNVYLDDKTGAELSRLAKSLGKSRNALVRQAVEDWLKHQEPHWPEAVLAFEGLPDMPPFESHRNGLRLPEDDPLAS